MTSGEFGNSEARRARSRAIIAEQAAAAARYQAEAPSLYHADAARAAAALAAQRDRDELDAARAALRPDFATSCALAAMRKQNSADFPRSPVVLPPDADSTHFRAVSAPVTAPDEGFTPPPCDESFVGPREPGTTIQTPQSLMRDAKQQRRRMEKHEGVALALATFIGPRTPAGARAAEELRGWHVDQWKEARAWLRSVQPTIAAYCMDRRSSDFAQAIEEFLRESEDDTGVSLSAKDYAEQTNKKTKLREMTAELCRRLESVGVQTRREDGCGLWTYWVQSGVWEEIDQWRRICVNPMVAAATRAPILAALEYFIQEHDFCRFWTFTTGPRCLVSEIGARLDVYSRKLSKLNHILRKKWGLEIVIAATEFGTLEREKGESDEGGTIAFAHIQNAHGIHSKEPVYHPHFHTVVRSLVGYRVPAKWDAVCRFVRAFWGCHCDFGTKGKSSVIRNPREIVKYVTKPGDLLKLTPAQLKAFYEATANRRLVRPMGLLRREIAERKHPSDGGAPRTLRRVKTGGGRAWKWIERIDHNKTLNDTISPEERESMDALIDAEVFAAECSAAAHAGAGFVDIGESLTLWDDGSTHREPAGRELVSAREIRLKDKPSFCQVVAFIPPAAGPTMRKENRVIVMGNRRDPEAVNRHPLVKQLRDRTWTAWAAGEALAGAEACFADASGIYVHTGTVTVPDELQTPGGWRLDDPISHATQMVFETA